MGHFLNQGLQSFELQIVTVKQKPIFLHNALGHFLGYMVLLFSSHLSSKRSGTEIIVLGTKNRAFKVSLAFFC